MIRPVDTDLRFIIVTVLHRKISFKAFMRTWQHAHNVNYVQSHSFFNKKSIMWTITWRYFEEKY